MRKTKIPHILVRTALAVAVGVSPAAAGAPLKAETGTASGLTTIVMQVMGKFAKRDRGVDIQINSGQTLTKTTLALATGKLDLTVAPPPAFALMQKGKGPYAKLGDEAAAASKNLRGLFGFQAGWFHAIVWADSGIESYADVKGRKVFTGPPAGTANLQSSSIIRAATGYEPNEDYESVRLSWGAGLHAMQDGQFDVFMRPAPIGAAVIEQLGAQRKFRLLPLESAALQTGAWREYTANPWHQPGVIPAGTYAGQANNDQDITTGSYTMQVAVHKEMDDDLAYGLAKAMFDNVEEAKAAAALLKYLDESDPLVGMNIPLHPGALRYFRENGISVPGRLIPPEAK